ncbi:MAG TPA: DUF934 domain-containing protein [Arenicellales bacterium]|nr:DUF934 domain-containing protein [Arenicellales bacterium]
MWILINRKIQQSRWSHRLDDEPLGTGDVTVTLARWLAERGSWNDRAGRVGVRLLPGDPVEELAPFVEQLALIAIEFEQFGEGRGYSQAYLLRERYGYRGELRAIGARRDHVMYMERCGMDAFEPAPCESVRSLLQGFDDISVRYQPSHDRSPLIFRQRARAAAAVSKEIQL